MDYHYEMIKRAYVFGFLDDAGLIREVTLDHSNWDINMILESCENIKKESRKLKNEFEELKKAYKFEGLSTIDLTKKIAEYHPNWNTDMTLDFLNNIIDDTGKFKKIDCNNYNGATRKVYYRGID